MPFGIIGSGVANQIIKKWGEKGLESFIKALSKGIVRGEKENGIKVPKKGIEKAGQTYTHEIKVTNKQYGDWRVFGYLNDAKEWVWDWFRKGLHK